jgi:hypothetical protein
MDVDADTAAVRDVAAKPKQMQLNVKFVKKPGLRHRPQSVA